MNSTAQFHRSFFSAPRAAANPRPSGSFAGALAASLTAKPEKLGIVESPEQPSLQSSAIADQPRTNGFLGRAWSWLTRNRAFGGEKQLRIVETVSLGEKRFVALLNVEGRKFLIGGGASGVSLLTPLDPAPDATPSSRPAEREQ